MGEMEAGRRSTLEGWKPRTRLGRMVLEGKVTTLQEILDEGYRIREVEIIDVLVPNLKEEVIDLSLVQKQTDAGERSRFRAVVAVGNGEGLLGLGIGKSSRVRNAIEKGITQAKLNIYPILRGCGSWECRCGEPHSLPFKVTGSRGGVEVTLIPGPKGLGLVAGETAKMILRLAGIKDCWSRARGNTKTKVSSAMATFEALKNTTRTMTQRDWAR